MRAIMWPGEFGARQAGGIEKERRYVEERRETQASLPPSMLRHETTYSISMHVCMYSSWNHDIC
jgi:hypothetical protein